jgi:hypothetical protein
LIRAASVDWKDVGNGEVLVTALSLEQEIKKAKGDDIKMWKWLYL